MNTVVIDPPEFAAGTIEQPQKQDEDDPICVYEPEEIPELVKEPIPTRQRRID